MTGLRFASAGALMALGVAIFPAHAAFSPFLAMAGSWSGGGIISMANGEREQLRCRANYNVAGRGEALSLNLRCASASYNFDLTSNVEYRGGVVSGEWSEASRNAGGTLEGRASADHVEVAARGQNFSADLSMTTRGGRQTVSIRPHGGDITEVSLALSRR
jgi:hypothetical protein